MASMQIVEVEECWMFSLYLTWSAQHTCLQFRDPPTACCDIRCLSAGVASNWDLAPFHNAADALGN